MKEFLPWPTWECVPRQPARTSLLPASPSSGPDGPACGVQREPQGCRRTRRPECGGTSLSNVRLPPLQILEPGPGAQVATTAPTAPGNPAERLPKRPQGVLLQKPSTFLRLKPGESEPPTRSSLGRDKHSGAEEERFDCVFKPIVI